MKIGSLFSGYGGLDLAVQAVLGGDIVWHVEFDKHPSKILDTHFPNVPNFGDVTAVDWAAVEPIDVLTGGFPCQDVSHAGNRRGIRSDTRSGLWSHMAQAIAKLRPTIVVIENVSGLLSAHADSDVEPCPWCVGNEPGGHMRALGAVLADLAEMGFDAGWASVRASDVGACHRRERVFIVATDADHRRRGQCLRTAVGNFRVAGDGGDQPVALLPTPAVNDMGAGKTVEQWDEWTASMRDRHGNGNGHGKSLAIEAQRLLPTPNTMDHLPIRDGEAREKALRRGETSVREGTGNLREDIVHLLPTPKASDGPNGGPGMRNGRGQADALPGVAARLLSTPTAAGGQRSHRWAEGSERTHNPVELAHDIADGRITDFGPYAAAIARWADVIGRPAPSPTEPGQNGRPRLSPAFVEWMMGLPEGWVTATDIPRSAQLKALGNGVVPQQAAAAIRELLAVMSA